MNRISSHSVEVIRTSDDLRGLEREWENLWCTDPVADVFSSYDWYRSWWDHFGCRNEKLKATVGPIEWELSVSEMRPNVLVFRDGAECVGLVPLISARVRWGLLPVRILIPPLNGQSPRSGMIGARGSDGVAPAVAAYLARNQDWDVLLLDGIPGTSEVVPTFREKASAEGVLLGEEDFPRTSSQLLFEGTWGDFLAGKKKHFRKSLRRSSENLSRVGRVEIVTYRTPEAVETGIREFMEVDAESWKSEKGECVASDPLLREFYISLLRRFSGRGRCEIWVLKIDAEPAVAFLCLIDTRWLYTLKGSYKMRFSSPQFSLGSVLLRNIIEGSWDKGLQGIDFCARMPFFDSWTNRQQKFDRVTAFRPGLYGTLARASGFGERFGKGAVRKIRRLLVGGWTKMVSPQSDESRSATPGTERNDE